MSVHRHAQAFGSTAEAYERGRPAFPAPALAHLASALELGPGRTLLDLAAGTGKLTRGLVGCGAEVVAVEPVAGMRAVFTRVLPDVPVIAGTAEAIPLRADSVDAVTVAQAFHWFDPVAAFAEMDRILRPAGRIALVWNVRDERDPIEAAATEILERHRDGTPGHRGLDLTAAIAASPFEEVDRFMVDWTQTVTRETFRDRFLSVSFVAALDEPTRAGVTHELEALFDARAVDGGVAHAFAYQSHVLARRAA